MNRSTVHRRWLVSLSVIGTASAVGWTAMSVLFPRACDKVFNVLLRHSGWILAGAGVVTGVLSLLFLWRIGGRDAPV